MDTFLARGGQAFENFLARCHHHRSLNEAVKRPYHVGEVAAPYLRGFSSAYYRTLPSSIFTVSSFNENGLGRKRSFHRTISYGPYGPALSFHEIKAISWTCFHSFVKSVAGYRNEKNKANSRI